MFINIQNVYVNLQYIANSSFEIKKMFSKYKAYTNRQQKLKKRLLPIFLPLKVSLITLLSVTISSRNTLYSA